MCRTIVKKDLEISQTSYLVFSYNNVRKRDVVAPLYFKDDQADQGLRSDIRQ